MTDKTFNFSSTHKDWMDRDGRAVFGWRYHPKVIFKSGRGTKITDVDGKDYYDLNSGMMSLPLGHSHPEVTEVIREVAGQMVHESSWYSNPWAIELAELIGSTLPPGLKLVNFAVTGSEANEIAMRMAIAKTGKFDIVSVIRGLHGGSLAVEALTTVGGGRRKGLGPLIMPARANAILPPFCYRCPVNLAYPGCDVKCLKTSEELMEHLTTKEIAGVIAEPILVPGGMIVPPKEWLPRLKELARRWGALLIFDEMQLAPARTGKFWAFEHTDTVPDIVTFGKGMSAGFAICGAATTKEIADEVRGKLGLPWSGTYPGDPLACAAAHKTIQIVLRERLTERSEKLGAILRRKLEGLRDRHECIGDIRGMGLYQMLDIVTDKASKTPDPAMGERIRYNVLLEGVAAICVKNFMRVSPPLIITEAEIDDIVGRLDTAIRRSLEGHPKDVDFSSSSSLAETKGQPGRRAAE